MNTPIVPVEIDHQRVVRMIRGYLEQEPRALEALEVLAQRFDPSNPNMIFDQAIAAWLMNRWNPEQDQPWKFHFLAYVFPVSRALFQHADVPKGLEDLERMAWVAAWPNTLPKSYDKADDISKRTLASLVWAWVQDSDTRDSFINRGIHPSFKPAFHQDGTRVAEAFIKALDRGFIAVPEERRISFLFDYAEWFANARSENGNPNHLAQYMGMGTQFIQELPVEVLQEMACINHSAAHTLGRRLIDLAIPRAQLRTSWMQGVSLRFAASMPIEEAVARFAEETSQVVRYWLYDLFHGNFLIPPPDDFFGEPVDPFWLAAGRPEQWPLPRPTFEEVVALLKERMPKP